MSKSVKNQNLIISDYPKRKVIFKKHFFSFVDMIITRDMGQKRYNYIENLSLDNKVKMNYHVNNLANRLHPNSQKLSISEIIVHDVDTKTFILKPTSANDKVSFFRAGQYLSVISLIDGVLISRPYSISSSPNDALNKNFYAITLKRKPNGYFSNYALNNWKVGTNLTTSGPEGEFYYDSIRDPKNIVAIAGGSGITPFLSMAKAIVEETEDFNLTIIFGNRKKENIFCLKELSLLEKHSAGKVKVVNVLSEEHATGFEHGFINKTIITKFLDDKSSIFMCGPKVMYKFIQNEISTLNLPRKNIRIEASNDIGKPTIYSHYKNIGNKLKYKIIVHQFGEIKEIDALSEDTILVSLQKAKITAPSKCLSGLCSWCRVKVKNGKVFTPNEFAHQRAADVPNMIYYSCSTFPITDLEIEAY
ncbi:MAG: FAD-binding oxidoreductase [Malacoplasma sp.]